ncbi:MAG: CRISPR-associated protein Csx19 [Candidatus Sumerlaeaceae bacterium]|nr:CRISPR-associated protein Csx19 [Candidatus Sumerlaeaceae bacterium]
MSGCEKVLEEICGCKVTKLNDDVCATVLNWVIKNSDASFPPCACPNGVKWLLAHCCDGVTWGYFVGTRWIVSATAFPKLSPQISKENLLELRLFGDSTEILIWRSSHGFEGRIVDDVASTSPEKYLQPAEEARLLLGDSIVDGPKNGFVIVRSSDGKEQAVPEMVVDLIDREPPLAFLVVKHYFAKNPETGAARIALSRLVALKKS